MSASDGLQVMARMDAHAAFVHRPEPAPSVFFPYVTKQLTSKRVFFTRLDKKEQREI